MSYVQFEEDNYEPVRQPIPPKTTSPFTLNGIETFLVEKGVFATKEQVKKILWIFVILAFCFIGFSYFEGGWSGGDTRPAVGTLSPQELMHKKQFLPSNH